MRHFFLAIYLFPALALAEKPTLLINEIKPFAQIDDPAWVEIYNASDRTINTLGWRIGNRDVYTIEIPALSLPPGSYLLLKLASGDNDLDASDGMAVVYLTDLPIEPFWHEDWDDAVLYEGGEMRDYLAWGSGSYRGGEAHAEALKAELWTKDDFIDLENIAHEFGTRTLRLDKNSSLGRDAKATDRNRGLDFYPDGGLNSMGPTPGTQNFTAFNVQQMAEGDPPSAASADKGRKWTILFYGMGDNDLDAFITKNVVQMGWGGGSTDEVAWVVHLDTLAMGGQDGNRAEFAWRGLVKKGNRPSLIPSLVAPAGESIRIPEPNSGDPRTLSDFIAWGKQHYPAENYVLIIAGHGQGWKLVGPDLGFAGERENMDFLHLGELSSALAGHQFHTIIFDACLMANLDVAVQLKSFAQYLIASEEVVPGEGFPFDEIAAEFVAQTPTPSALHKIFIDKWESQAARISGRRPYQMGLIDLKVLDQALGRLNRGFAAMLDSIPLTNSFGQSQDTTIRSLSLARANSIEMEDQNFIDMVDLLERLAMGGGGLPDCLIDGLAAAFGDFRPEARRVVIDNRQKGFARKVNGLTLYYPRSELAGERGSEPFYQPFTRQSNGSSPRASYGPNRYQMPRAVLDFEWLRRENEVKVLKGPEDWPSKPSPGLDSYRELIWNGFLQRYFRPVAEIQLIPSDPNYQPSRRPGGNACKQPVQTLALPLGQSAILSARGSSDAERRPLEFFWDLNHRVNCTNCVNPWDAKPTEVVSTVVTNNADADEDAGDSLTDDVDARGVEHKFTCEAPGEHRFTLNVWNDAYKHYTGAPVPNGQHVRISSASHTAELECVAIPLLRISPANPIGLFVGESVRVQVQLLDGTKRSVLPLRMAIVSGEVFEGTGPAAITGERLLVTGPDGSLVLNFLMRQVGRAVLRFFVPGTNVSQLVELVAEARAISYRLSFDPLNALVAGRTVPVRVLLVGNNVPVPGQSIQLITERPELANFGGQSTTSATTGSDGRALVNLLLKAAGQVALRALFFQNNVQMATAQLILQIDEENSGSPPAPDPPPPGSNPVSPPDNPAPPPPPPPTNPIERKGLRKP